MTTPLIETMARAIVPAMLETSESYSDVPPDHIWTRPGYQRLAEASRRHAQAALTAITEAGMVIVPREPTEAMLQAYLYPPSVIEDFDRDDGADVAEAYDRAMGRATWGVMIAAATPLNTKEGE